MLGDKESHIKKKLVDLKILQFVVRIRFECGTGTGIGFLLADK